MLIASCFLIVLRSDSPPTHYRCLNHLTDVTDVYFCFFFLLTGVKLENAYIAIRGRYYIAVG